MRHHAKFKLPLNVEVPEQNTWIYKNWWNKMRRALKKFGKDIPSSVNKLQHEERQFHIMGLDYDF
ncbi:hypothetical protein T10_9313 [Trichinella papuae]|uniref:Uncharacterized protein n=1 Tax=Trichinella papuae TaxID=268474 RepID=A0A0V1M405_9BILA|nr:hypothetical protein T10_2987 [Trichinella papuae]KRZ65515.1 hypothetical protein T10_1962 [Trichinella papuae]KRZ66447.1 hypothetical protein T10_9313 [Trichinella papuae]